MNDGKRCWSAGKGFRQWWMQLGQPAPQTAWPPGRHLLVCPSAGYGAGRIGRIGGRGNDHLRPRGHPFEVGGFTSSISKIDNMGFADNGANLWVKDGGNSQAGVMIDAVSGDTEGHFPATELIAQSQGRFSTAGIDVRAGLFSGRTQTAERFSLRLTVGR